VNRLNSLFLTELMNPWSIDSCHSWM